MDDLFPHLKPRHLHSLKAAGHHALAVAREEGGDTTKPLLFIGAVTVMLGAMAIWEAQRKAGRSR